NLKNKKIIKFEIYGKEYECKSNIDAYLEINKILCDLHKEDYINLSKENLTFISNNMNSLSNTSRIKKISENIFVNINYSSTELFKFLKQIIKKINLDGKNILLHIQIK
uniref:hypothetical protein n=1 Tax=Oceanivirga salmonicida TaxID=1769291 RepID=UPI0018D21999